MSASMCDAGGWKTRQAIGSVAPLATAFVNHRVERAVASQSTPSANTNRVEGGRGKRRSGFNNAIAVQQRGGCSPSERSLCSALNRSIARMLRLVEYNYSILPQIRTSYTLCRPAGRRRMALAKQSISTTVEGYDPFSNLCGAVHHNSFLGSGLHFTGRSGSHTRDT